MSWSDLTLRRIAKMICGDDFYKDIFIYRTSNSLTNFFEECGLEFRHDGSTRSHWVFDRLKEVYSYNQHSHNVLSDSFLRILQRLLCIKELDSDKARRSALSELNKVIKNEKWEAFYDTNITAQFRHVPTNNISRIIDPHRPLSSLEVSRRDNLRDYLSVCSEDDLINEILLPLFRQLGFIRITPTGHRDKQLEYGKDVWMKFILPTTHILYFGIQVKKGRLDTSSSSGLGSANVAEILNQIGMMLGHEIFDPELNRRVLVDHAFIVAGGEITKQARNWLGQKLDHLKRSQIMFMDKEDIVNLFVVTNLPVPIKKLSVMKQKLDDDIPF